MLRYMVRFYQRPTANGPIKYLSCSSEHVIDFGKLVTWKKVPYTSTKSGSLLHNENFCRQHAMSDRIKIGIN